MYQMVVTHHTTQRYEKISFPSAVGCNGKIKRIGIGRDVRGYLEKKLYNLMTKVA